MVHDPEYPFYLFVLYAVVEGRSEKHDDHGSGKNHMGNHDRRASPFKYEQDQSGRSKKNAEPVKYGVGCLFSRCLKGKGSGNGI
jgi:hypothetical protein